MNYVNQVNSDDLDTDRQRSSKQSKQTKYTLYKYKINMGNANAIMNVCPPQRHPRRQKHKQPCKHTRIEFLSITIGNGQRHTRGSNNDE